MKDIVVAAAGVEPAVSAVSAEAAVVVVVVAEAATVVADFDFVVGVVDHTAVEPDRKLENEQGMPNIVLDNNLVHLEQWHAQVEFEVDLDHVLEFGSEDVVAVGVEIVEIAVEVAVVVAVVVAVEVDVEVAVVVAVEVAVGFAVEGQACFGILYARQGSKIGKTEKVHNVKTSLDSSTYLDL